LKELSTKECFICAALHCKQQLGRRGETYPFLFELCWKRLSLTLNIAIIQV